MREHLILSHICNPACDILCTCNYTPYKLCGMSMYPRRMRRTSLYSLDNELIIYVKLFLFQPYLTQLSLDISVPPNLRLLYLQVQSGGIKFTKFSFYILSSKMRQSNQFLYSNWSNPRILNLTAAFLDTPKRLGTCT